MKKGEREREGRKDIEGDLLSISREGTFKLVENAIILVQIAQFTSQVIVHVDRLYRFRLHVDVPNLES